VVDGGYNLDDDGTCRLSSANHSLSDNHDVNFSGGLANNGGATRTVALASNSSAAGAIPAGTNGCAATVASDQRGISRPGTLTASCSIGAYEYVVPVTTSITSCLQTPSFFGLLTKGGYIVFDADCTANLAAFKRSLIFQTNTMINANGHTVTFGGPLSNQFPIFKNGGVLVLNGVTISHGGAPEGESCSAICDTGGTLVLLNSTVSLNNGNAVANTGALYENGAGITVVTNSTFEDNLASSAIVTDASQGGDPGLVVSNSTLLRARPVLAPIITPCIWAAHPRLATAPSAATEAESVGR
jgi:hypothetical protein